MKIQTEQQVLDQVFRATVIKEIGLPENQMRKAEAYRRYQCFRDCTDEYVLEMLLKQFDASTVTEMQYAVTNISFVKKVIDKLSRVYANGVKRTLPKKTDTKALEEMAKHLKFNRRMKKSNRYLKLFKNLSIYIRPVEVDGKFDIKVRPLEPFLYDVIEDPKNEDLPFVYILSDYVPGQAMKYAIGNAAMAGRTPGVKIANESFSDGIDNTIADKDKEGGKYIWWTKNYHFTTNKKGEIIDGGLDNPIKQLPFVNIAEDRDDGFWAEGGKDLIDAGIKINSLLTNINHLAITQGYGQFYMTGKNLPKSIKLGPNHAITVEQGEGEPAPTMGFLTANPPLAELIKTIEFYVALLLSTNNLSTSGFASTLSSGASFPSGVAMIIDKAESIEDVEDQAEEFIDSEPEIWARIALWHAVYKGRNLLTDKLAKIKMPEKIDELGLQFPKPQIVLSEKEELEILQKRLELGLNTEIEILMRDDPSLTEEMAKQKLLLIQEEKLAKMLKMAPQAGAEGSEPNQSKGVTDDDESAQSNRKPEQDDDNPRA